MTHEETEAQGTDLIWPRSPGSNECWSLDSNLDLPGSKAPAEEHRPLADSLPMGCHKQNRASERSRGRRWKGGFGTAVWEGSLMVGWAGRRLEQSTWPQGMRLSLP